MPPLLPDEATKAQETFRLGDRFYVEEHGLVLGELLGINDTWFRFIFVLTVDSEEKSKSLTENGFYICVNESVSPYDNTFLIVLSAQNDNTVVQFLVSANGKSVKVRTKWWGDGWSEWNLIGS